MTQRPYNHAPWSDAEYAELHRLVAAGWHKHKIAKSFPGRSITAVEGRLAALGLTPKRLTTAQRSALARQPQRPSQSAWPEADVEQLKQLAAQGLGPAEIGRRMGRTARSIIGKLDRVRRRENGPPADTPERAARISRQNAIAGRMSQAKQRKAARSEVARLAAEGYSAAEIGKALGRTRDSVLGQARREDIKLRGLKSGPRKSKTGKNNNPTGITVTRLMAGKSRAPEPLPTASPVAAPVSIADVGRNACRYIGERPEIVTDGTPIFCGRPGYPYCPEHRARCYVPVRGATERNMTKLVRQL